MHHVEQVDTLRIALPGPANIRLGIVRRFKFQDFHKPILIDVPGQPVRPAAPTVFLPGPKLQGNRVIVTVDATAHACVPIFVELIVVVVCRELEDRPRLAVVHIDLEYFGAVFLGIEPLYQHPVLFRGQTRDNPGTEQPLHEGLKREARDIGLARQLDPGPSVNPHGQELVGIGLHLSGSANTRRIVADASAGHFHRLARSDQQTFVIDPIDSDDVHVFRPQGVGFPVHVLAFIHIHDIVQTSSGQAHDRHVLT